MATSTMKTPVHLKQARRLVEGILELFTEMGKTNAKPDAGKKSGKKHRFQIIATVENDKVVSWHEVIYKKGTGSVDP